MGAEDVPLEEAAERARELYECMFALRRQARCLSFISESARPATTPIDFAFEIQRELSSCDELDLNDLRIGEVTAIPASSDDEVHVDVVVEHAGDPIGANWWSTRWVRERGEWCLGDPEFRPTIDLDYSWPDRATGESEAIEALIVHAVHTERRSGSCAWTTMLENPNPDVVAQVSGVLHVDQPATSFGERPFDEAIEVDMGVVRPMERTRLSGSVPLADDGSIEDFDLEIIVDWDEPE